MASTNFVTMHQLAASAKQNDPPSINMVPGGSSTELRDLPIQLKRAGVPADLWANTFDAVIALKQRQDTDLEERTPTPETHGHPILDVSVSIFRVLAWPCLGSPYAAHEMARCENAQAMRPEWISLMQKLQPQFDPYGIDLAPFNQSVAFIDRQHFFRVAGFIFYLPNSFSAGNNNMIDGGDNPRSETTCILEELGKLVDFHKQGALTDREFAQLKAKLID